MIKTTFLNSILISKFHFINSKVSVAKKRSVNSSISLPNAFFCSLDLFFLNKSLKQFVRVLRLAKRKKRKISIFVSNPYIKLFLEDLLIYDTEKDILSSILQIEGLYIKTSNIKRNVCVLVGTDYSNSAFMDKLLEEGVFLITSIHAGKLYHKKSFGAYKIFSDLKEIQKIIFLYVLIRKIII
jgi:hypothetical protein